MHKNECRYYLFTTQLYEQEVTCSPKNYLCKYTTITYKNWLYTQKLMFYNTIMYKKYLYTQLFFYKTITNKKLL